MPIRGKTREPIPQKGKEPNGVFLRRDAEPTHHHTDNLTQALSVSPKKPVKRDNKLPSHKGGHYRNQGLKRGTAK